MKRPYGFAPSAWTEYLVACQSAGISPDRVVQTIGNAKASAGYHAKDGTENGAPYCAAVDLSVRGLTQAQVKKWLAALAKAGFAAWYRFEGSWANNKHIHAIYCGLDMKEPLFLQVVDFVNDRNGLVGHAVEKFYTAPPELDKPLVKALKAANPKLWAKYEDRIPAAYRKDTPPKLLVNDKIVEGAYLAGGHWYAQEGALAEILGGPTMNPSLIQPVDAVFKRWGWRVEKYTGRLATMNRVDIRAVKA